MKPHLSESDIIRLLNRTAADTRQLHDHLAECDRCLADFKFMAQCQFSSDPDRLPEDDRTQLIKSGMTVARRMRVFTKESESTHPAGVAPRRRAPLRRMAAVVAGLAIVVAAVWIWQARVQPSPVRADIAEPILTAMITFSNTGPVVLPRTEDDLVNGNSRYRSGISLAGAAVVASLDTLSKHDQNKAGSRELFFWKTGGYFTTGQFKTASDVARTGSEMFPNDWEIITLYALAAYYQDDLATAEEELRRVLKINPDYFIARVNLGLVLAERGSVKESHVVLSRVVEGLPGTPLADRAKELMKRLH